MSYILDALKKAAEQRSGPPPEVRRLLSPAPVAAAPPARYVAVAAAAAGAIAVAAIVWMWPGPTHDAPAPTARPVGSVVAVSPPAADRPRAQIAESPRAPVVDRRAAITDTRTPIAETARASVADTPRAPTKPRAETPPRALAETRRPLPLIATAPPMPTPPLVASLPPTASAQPRTDVAKLRVEVIVYSDQRPLRWVYISGKKYVEGDAIGDGARIEEIQSTSVILVEDGRRITLRP